MDAYRGPYAEDSSVVRAPSPLPCESGGVFYQRIMLGPTACLLDAQPGVPANKGKFQKTSEAFTLRSLQPSGQGCAEVQPLS